MAYDYLSASDCFWYSIRDKRSPILTLRSNRYSAKTFWEILRNLKENVSDGLDQQLYPIAVVFLWILQIL